ncbi:MAG: hypothetical protein IPL91_08260 [Hyphomicrobium sp.]|nr:hypothetical protein [Hyphomicrobium sp.]
MPKAYIINFTGFFGHWGMYGTSMAVTMGLAEKGYDADYLAVNEIASLFPEQQAWDEMKSSAAFRLFEARNPQIVTAMGEADIVVVNGEGTLHGVRPSSLNLLALMFYARKYLKRPVYLINTAFYPTPFDGIGSVDCHAPYAETLHALGHRPVVVRDRASFSNVEELGGKAILGFDCLPLLARALPRSQFSPRDGRILLTASAGCTPTQAKELSKTIARTIGARPHVGYLSGGTAKYNAFERQFHEAMSDEIAGLALDETETFLDFCKALDGSLLISGRFHYLIAGAWMNAKLAPFESNTRKNTELIADVGVRLEQLFAPTGPVSDTALLRNAISRARPVSAASKQRCEKRSLRNFSRIRQVGPPVRSTLVHEMAKRLGCPMEMVGRITPEPRPTEPRDERS